MKKRGRPCKNKVRAKNVSIRLEPDTIDKIKQKYTTVQKWIDLVVSFSNVNIS